MKISSLARSGRFLLCLILAGLLLAGASPSHAQFINGTLGAGLTWNQTTWGAAFADMDGDEDLELFSGHHIYAPTIFWNAGLGTFNPNLYPQPWSGPLDRHGVLVLTLDNDPDPEIFITHGADGGVGSEADELYLNDGPGTFLLFPSAGGMSDPPGRGRAASAADYDGNKKVDVFVAKAPDPQSKNSLYKNNGGLSFTDVAATAGIDEGLGTVGGIFGDFDNDNDPDLLVGGEEFARPTTLWKNNAGVFANANALFTPALPVISGADWGDMDNDGDLDLAICTGDIGIFDTFSEGDSVSYFFNTRYADTGIDGLTIPSTADTLFARFRIRAILDTSKIFLGPLAVNPPLASEIVLTNAYVGQPAFTPGVSQGTYVWRTAPGGNWEIRCSTPDLNFDNFDGWVTGAAPLTGVTPHDLEIPTFTPGKPHVYRNNNNGTSFTDITVQLGLPTMLNPRDISWVDYDNDGDLDLHVVDMGTSASPNAPDALLRNDGAVFTDVTSAEAMAGGTQGMGDGGVWADIDDDRDLDLFLQEGAGPLTFSAFAPAHLLVNDGDRGNALLFDIIGRQSGAAAIGTKVTVVAGGQRVCRRVQANAWRGFQDPARVHCGIGSAAYADSVIVAWPTGTVQVFLSLGPDVWRVEEGFIVSSAHGIPAPSNADWSIARVFPQPASEGQSIVLSAPREVSLVVAVHDLAGRVVRTLHSGSVGPGTLQLTWDGRNAEGKRVGAGIYWVRASGENVEKAVKAVRIR